MNFEDDVLLVAQGGGVMSVEILTGVYKAFEEAGKIPGKVRASSGGALFSGLYYSGHNSAWFYDLMQKKSLLQWISPAPGQAVKSMYGKSNYMLQNKGLFDFLYSNMTAEAMERVQVSVTKLNDYTSELVPATPTWVLAATSIPYLFKPVQLEDGSLYGDGGILDNIPVPPLEEIKKYRKAYIVLTPPTKPGDTSGISGLVTLLSGVMDREVAQISDAGYLDLDNVVLIQPSVDHGGSLLTWSENFGLMSEAYNITSKLITNQNKQEDAQ